MAVCAVSVLVHNPFAGGRGVLISDEYSAAVPSQQLFISQTIHDMKKILCVLLLTLTAFLPLAAQQQQGDPRSHSIFAFKDFKDAKIIQPFNRFTTAKANIFLKNSSLCFMKDDKIMEAFVQNVLGVKFDSIEYVKLDNNQMGRVLAQKGYNYLVAVTTINQKKLREETTGGDNMPFLEIPDAGAFFEIDGQAFEFDKGYPLTTRYYFKIMGKVVPAMESAFKPYVRPEMMSAFKRLMNDKFWSWNDPASLQQLFTYLPD